MRASARDTAALDSVQPLIDVFKRYASATLALLAGMACASVDVNKATQAELESVKGIGPDLSAAILDERTKSPFKNWNDFVRRVKGVGARSAARHSTDGLTVNGATFKGATTASMPAASSP